MAAEYFKGTEVADTANRIFNEVQWRNCKDPLTGYTEFLIMNIIGSGSPTYAWKTPACRNAWNQSTATTNYWAPLFVYQWPQNYADFRSYRDDNNVNHYQVAQDVIISQRWQCIQLHKNNPAKYKDYGPDCWGLTSATASPRPEHDETSRYLELNPWPGRDANNIWHNSEYWSDSGSVVPICPPAWHTSRVTSPTLDEGISNWI